ncbi:GIY-YIG nuclease family protein [Bradyrhizobium cenepequi]
MPAPGYVYFITDGDAIKIGFARNVEKRLRSLQTSHHVPLRLLGAVVAQPEDEKEMHARLAHRRILGEWFEVHGDVFDVLMEMEQDGGYVEGDSDSDYQKRVVQLQMQS